MTAAMQERQDMAEKRYLSIEAEAKRLGVGTRTLDRRCKDEQFPYIKFGGRVLFDPELSDRYLADRVHNGRAAELAHQAAA